MRHLIRALLAVAALASVPAFAQEGFDITVTWEVPQTRTDGSALPAAEYGGTLIFWGEGSGGPYEQMANILGETGSETVQDDSLEWDTLYCFFAVAYDTEGRQSSPTDEVCIQTPMEPVAETANPSPPADLTLTVEVV